MIRRAPDVVFVGPSLPPVVLRAHWSGAVRPPIGRGELDALVQSADRPTAVGIVDGRFLQDLAVTPKEVLRALDAGVRVYGASSMGALRAVECAPYGAVGIGKIFAMFRDGTLDADDEVALSYDPDTLRATSEPLVNIRLAMAYAGSTGLLRPGTADLAVSVAHDLYFPERSYRNLARQLAPRLPTAELDAFLAFVTGPDCPDQKRDDAVELLDAMTAAQHRPGQRPDG